MAGFIRRFGYFPGLDVITQIEGVAIIDLAPPGSVQGAGTGLVACVGEFTDMTYGVDVDSTGTVTTAPTPVEVLGAQDMLNKVGGFDATIGDFGVSGGNGYASVRGKQYARLVLAPINLCSSKAMRFFRNLPVCTSATDSDPVVNMQGITVAAGTEFRASSARVRTGAKFAFTALATIAQGLGGATASGVSAATQTFNATSGFDWTTIQRPDGSIGAHKGDILVIGSNNAGAFLPLLESGTYRVAAEPASGVSLVVESLSGASFAWTSQTSVPWRLHYGSDADSAPNIVVHTSGPGGYIASDGGGCTIPVRPLTDSTGSATGSSAWTQGTLVAPAVTPTTATGNTWDPMSGLGGFVMYGGSGGLTYTAAIQRPNAVCCASIEALYVAALAALIGDADPLASINIVFAARTSAVIRNAIKSHVLVASGQSYGRVGLITPELTISPVTSVVVSADPGVGANRSESIIYTWPPVMTYIPEAVGFPLKASDGSIVTSGTLDMPFDSWFASVLSLLPPERNPGQGAEPVLTALSSVLGIARVIPPLGMVDYIRLKAAGIAAIRIDKTVGPVIQSGITTSLVSGQTSINRRRFAYFVQDSLASRLVTLSKLPSTQAARDNHHAECVAFCEELLSRENPAAQRIDGYLVDDVSGNTPDTRAAGINVIIVRIRMTPTDDYIVLQTEIGTSVTVTAQTA